jgi:hypothetical protein
MPMATELLFSAWRTADRKARVLEHALALASLQSAQGAGGAPSPEEIEQARRLRKRSDDLVLLAMTEMVAWVDQIRERTSRIARRGSFRLLPLPQAS